MLVWDVQMSEGVAIASGYARRNRIFLIQALLAGPSPSCPTAVWEDVDRIAASTASDAIAAARANAVHPTARSARLRALPYDGVVVSASQEQTDSLAGLVRHEDAGGDPDRRRQDQQRQRAPREGAQIIPFPRQFRPPPRGDAG